MSAGRDFRDLDGADPWKLLGVARDADADEIRRSYRRLSRSHHTDVGGDADQQARLNRAYEVLSDPSRRDGYALLLNRQNEPQQTQTSYAEPEPDEPVADPFEWSSGPTPNFTQPPPRQPYTSHQEPYVAPQYDPEYDQTFQDPYVAPPYRGPYSDPSYRRRKQGVNGRAVAALVTVMICSPVSIVLAIQALRTMRWSGQRGKTVAWIALVFDAIFIASFVYTQLK